jgi:hypothetical protein
MKYNVFTNSIENLKCMSKKITLLSTLRQVQCVTLCFLLLTLGVNAQTPPNAFNYSAVARNAAGQPIATTTIGIQIAILKTSPTGVSQYSENHFVNTDAFGLFNLVIGAGAVQSGSMTTIDWSNDNYYLKVGMDAAGGTNFLIMGTTQLLSVPYAMYAKSAGSVSGGGTGGGGFTHYIGEEFGGGVVFHLWKDASGVEHGLIIDKTDLSAAQVWSNIDATLIGASAQSMWYGLSNSNAIVGQAGHTSSASALCLNSTNGAQSDWYLPSLQELNMLWDNYYTVGLSLTQISGATQLQPADYYSSTENGSTTAWHFNFNDGSAGPTSYNAGNTISYGKNYANHVRAVRAF